MPHWGGNEKLPIYNGAQEEHQRRVTPGSTRPNWSSGKCAPAPVVRSSSSSRHRRCLIRPAKAGSTSPSECQAGSSSWTGQVMASPRSRAEVLRPAHKRPVRDRVDAQVSDQHLAPLPSFGWPKPVRPSFAISTCLPGSDGGDGYGPVWKTPRRDGWGRPAPVPEPPRSEVAYRLRMGVRLEFRHRYLWSRYQ